MADPAIFPEPDWDKITFACFACKQKRKADNIKTATHDLSTLLGKPLAEGANANVIFRYCADLANCKAKVYSRDWVYRNIGIDFITQNYINNEGTTNVPQP